MQDFSVMKSFCFVSRGRKQHSSSTIRCEGVSGSSVVSESYKINLMGKLQTASQCWCRRCCKNPLAVSATLHSPAHAGCCVFSDKLWSPWNRLLTSEAWRLWFWLEVMGPGCDRSPWASPSRWWISATNPSCCTRWRRWSRYGVGWRIKPAAFSLGRDFKIPCRAGGN